MAKRDYTQFDAQLTTPEAPEPVARDYGALEQYVTTSEASDGLAPQRQGRIRNDLIREWGGPDGMTALEWDIEDRLNSLDGIRMQLGRENEQARVIASDDWIAERDQYEADRTKQIEELRWSRMEARNRVLDRLKAGADKDYRARVFPSLTPQEKEDAVKYQDRFWDYHWRKNEEPELQAALKQDWQDWSKAIEAKMQAVPDRSKEPNPFRRDPGLPGAGEALSLFARDYLDIKLPRFIEHGLDLQSVEGAIAIGRSKKLPKSASYKLSGIEKVLSAIVGLSSPLSIATFGVGGAGGAMLAKRTALKTFIEENAKQSLKTGVSRRVLARIASHGIEKALGLGSALAFHSATTDMATQIGLLDRVDIMHTLNTSAESAALGFAAGAAGVAGGAVFPGLGLVGEVAAFGTGGAFLEGRIPELEDFEQAAGVIVGAKVAIGATKLAGAKIFETVSELTKTAEQAREEFKRTAERQAAEKKIHPWTIEEINGGDPFGIYKKFTLWRMEGVIAAMRAELTAYEAAKANPVEGQKLPSDKMIKDLRKELSKRQGEYDDWTNMEHNPYRDMSDSHVETYANANVSLAKMELHRRRTGVESLVPVQAELQRFYRGNPTMPNNENLLHIMDGIDQEITMGITDDRVKSDFQIIERFLKEKDIEPMAPWVFGPEFAASGHKGGRWWTARAIEAGMSARHETDMDYDLIDKLERVLKFGLGQFKVRGKNFREWLQTYYSDLDMVDAARKLQKRGLKFSDVRSYLSSARSGARDIDVLPELNGRQIARIRGGDYGPFSPAKGNRPAGIFNNLSLFYVVDKVADWFSTKRAQVVDYKKTMYRLSLGARQLRVFERVHDQYTRMETAAAEEKPTFKRSLDDIINEILAEPQNEGISPNDVKDMLADYKDIDNWGKEFYIPRFEFGSYRGEIVTDAEKDIRMTIAVAPTRRVLVERIIDWVAKNAPETQKVFIQKGPTFTSSEAMEMVGRGKYWAIRSRFANQAAKDIESVLEVEAPSFTNEEDVKVLAKIIADEAAKRGMSGNIAIKPPFKKAGPLLRSRGILEGEEDLISAMRYYALQVNRKLALDPVIFQFRQFADKDLKDAPNIREMIENQLLVEKGNYSFGDKVVDGLINKVDQWLLKKSGGRYDTSSIPWLNIRSQMYSKWIADVRRTVATLKLGYRPVAGLVNAASGMNHLATKVGFHYIYEARRWLGTPEGKAFMKVNSPFMGISFILEEGEIARPTRLRPWSPMFAFQYPEKYLRETTLAANFLYARGQGMGDEAAALFARRALRFQQFVYNAAALPYLLQGPSGKLLGQFKSYLVNEIQYLYSLRGSKRQILTYAGLQWAFGGTKGLMYLLYGLPVVGWVLENSGTEKWMNEQMPGMHRGLPTMLPRSVNLAFGTDLPEVDLSMQFVPSVPHTNKDWASFLVGPMLTDFYGFGKWAYESLFEDVPDARARGLDLANNLFVAWKYFQEGLSIKMDRDGHLTDMRGNTVWKPQSPVDIMLHMIGARSADHSLQSDTLRQFGKDEAIKRKQMNAQGDKVLRLIQQYFNRNHITNQQEFDYALERMDNATNGFMVDVAGALGGGYPKDFAPIAEAIGVYVDLGGNAKSLLEQVGQARLEPITRTLLNTTLKKRPELIESWRNFDRFRQRGLQR